MKYLHIELDGTGASTASTNMTKAELELAILEGLVRSKDFYDAVTSAALKAKATLEITPANNAELHNLNTHTNE